jgi:monoamine oxidase
MYDHTNFEEDKYALKGFLNGGAASYSTEVRKENVLRQLSELPGDEAHQPIAYFDKVWNDEFILEGNPMIERPHQNNGHPILQIDYLNGKLLFCGTETASEFPGYMEGAVDAAIRVAERIK